MTRATSTARTHHRHERAVSRDEHLVVMADLFALLSDRTRLRVLSHLAEHGEACVGDLATAAGISESAVSHALRLLRAHDIVDSRRDGRFVFYFLADEHVGVLLDATSIHFESRHA